MLIIADHLPPDLSLAEDVPTGEMTQDSHDIKKKHGRQVEEDKNGAGTLSLRASKDVVEFERLYE